MKSPNYVKKGQVFMCRFEDCWDRTTSCISTNEAIIANIKPEIGKIRPVVVVHPHKRHKLAVVVPFTSQKPLKEDSYTVFVPIGEMPGILAKKECWVLCDMVKVVSLDRLQLPFSKKKEVSTLNDERVSKICSIVQSIFR